jgi:lipoprotein-anchoring transpeptidase ErfK/SrfK
MNESDSVRGRRRADAGRRAATWAAVVVALALCAVFVVVLRQGAGHPVAMHPQSTSPEGGREDQVANVPHISAAALAALPAARYDAVIAGLMPYTGPASSIAGRYRLASDAPLFGADRRTPVARMTAKDFLGAATTVVVAGRSGPFSLVLTPARVSLPSTSGGTAPAQSAGWIQTSALQRVGDLDERIVISVRAQKLTIVRGTSDVAAFPVGVGTPGTPTPTGVTGYLQARYLDPRQGETVYPIQLTSLHSSSADEPYGGDDGGLIGVHFNAVNSGAVSHGCVRLSEAAIEAVNALPLGTPITIQS